MASILISFLAMPRSVVRSRMALHLEVLALRHQLQVLQRSGPRRLRLAKADRWLWAWLSRSWEGWRTALVIVKLETVIAWHRQGFACSGGGRADATGDRLSPSMSAA
jgi:putative transposase